MSGEGRGWERTPRRRGLPKAEAKAEAASGKAGGERYEPPPGTWDDSLPYGGKVMLARQRKPEPLWFRVFEGAFVVGLLYFAYFSYHNLDTVVFHVHKAYAHFGHTEAQHSVGEKYLQGVGVEADRRYAMKWFQRAANRGHAHASYNLAVGHLKGHHKLRRGDAHRYIKHAAAAGVKEAVHVLHHVCRKRNGCD